ncbi:glycosyltransferase [Lichenihabitans psoromatis]|uniref:glycosyltransferase n=1 Tax=Lichenihabitans psoromatis TaxID=2528642 RepID=UPI0010384E2C|nr:glycosyltransferase [Lichenihabitans psoromatis]
MSDLPRTSAPYFPPHRQASEFHGFAAECRRLSPAVLWHLFNRPFSRLRHDAEDRRVAERFRKIEMARRPTSADVCIIGAFSAKNGLSRAARYELDRIAAVHPFATKIDVTDQVGTLSLAAYAAERRDDPPAIVIFLMQPNLIWKHLRNVAPSFLRDSYRICLAVWELPYFPAHWKYIDEVFHEYWTPTSFSAEALRLGSTRDVTVVPHPVKIARSGSQRIARREGAPFKGLAVMDLSTCPDRKNPWAHIEAWQKAFGDHPGATLTMKVRFSRRTAPIRRELLDMIGQSKTITLLEAEMTDAEMVALQEQHDVCLSLHRSEGFGLGICEMLEMGKPAVATAWSGNIEFMARYPHAYPVEYKLVPYRDYLRRYPGYRGHWAEADTDHAARCLRVIAAQWADRSSMNWQVERDRLIA